jgi:hypothetical protein
MTDSLQDVVYFKFAEFFEVSHMEIFSPRCMSEFIIFKRGVPRDKSHESIVLMETRDGVLRVNFSRVEKGDLMGVKLALKSLGARVPLFGRVARIDRR